MLDGCPSEISLFKLIELKLVPSYHSFWCLHSRKETMVCMLIKFRRKKKGKNTYEMKLCALAAVAAFTTSSSLASGFPNMILSRMLPE